MQGKCLCFFTTIKLLLAFIYVLMPLFVILYNSHMAKPFKLKTASLLTITRLTGRAMRAQLRQQAFVTTLLIGLMAGLALQVNAIKPSVVSSDNLNRKAIADVFKDYGKLAPKLRQLQDSQTKSGIVVADSQTVQNDISPIYFYAENDSPAPARRALVKLEKDYKDWQSQYDRLTQAKKAAAIAAAPPIPGIAFNVPVLIYHQTPADFENQLLYLRAHGYTTTTLQVLTSALHGGAGLPPKPVIITFDDGFSNQFNAFHLLQKYNMKATFFIINGGAMSNWCIGANRHAGLPCGDAYFNWDEIRMLDQSGLINIGGHTIDHPNLPTLSVDQQRQEIIDGKAEIEQQLGHPILDFAYPYGSFDANTVQLVKDAGYESAVSTIPGTQQGAGNLYSLYRIRDPYTLH